MMGARGRPKKADPQSRRVQVYLTHGQGRWVELEAKRQGISESAVIGALIDEQLLSHQRPECIDSLDGLEGPTAPDQST